MFVYVCVCAERLCSLTVRVCEKENKHFVCCEFVLLFPPNKGNNAIKGTKSAGVCYSSQRGSQLCENVGCV